MRQRQQQLGFREEEECEEWSGKWRVERTERLRL